MYIIIVDTKEYWSHYTVITDEKGYPAEFETFEKAEEWFVISKFADNFSVRYINMDE